MNPQNDATQTLIAEIDRTLRKTQSRSPWGLCKRLALQNRLLERVRQVLAQQALSPASLSRSTRLAADQSAGQSAGQSAYQPANGSLARRDAALWSKPEPKSPAAPSALNDLSQDIQQLRSSLLGPLQSEVKTLTDRRLALQSEIQQLEAQKQTAAQSALVQASPPLPLEIEHLEALRDRNYQLLNNLDSSLHLVFETLQKNLLSYQTSLEQGVDRMHHMGQQGEVMFAALVNHLAQELGREASTYVTNNAASAALNPAAPPQIPPAASLVTPQQLSPADRRSGSQAAGSQAAGSQAAVSQAAVSQAAVSQAAVSQAVAPSLLAAPIGPFESSPPLPAVNQTPSQPLANALPAARINATAVSDGDTIQTLADLFPEVSSTYQQDSQVQRPTTVHTASGPDDQRAPASQPSAPHPAPPLNANLTDLTLAGMDDLFAATPAAPSQRPTPPTETAADTLDALFTNFTAALEGPSSPASRSTVTADSMSMVTLEDVEQLFADVPAAPPKSF